MSGSRLTLAQACESQGDYHQKFGKDGAIQVFPSSRAEYYMLTNYVVSSTASGPSLVLIPRQGQS